MPELRQDSTTKEWVIIATERAKRPHDFITNKKKEALPSFGAACPFCPGNESETPPEVLAYHDSRKANTSGWGGRVSPNKYPALINRCTIVRKENGKIFKNHGKSAGTSLDHPHSQLVATPIVPMHIRRKYEVATSYYDDTSRCIYCDMVREELKSDERIVIETDKFVVFHPFASRSPFETWIAPKRHLSSFGNVPTEDIVDLARVLKTTLFKIYNTLGDPDFNYVIHTAPGDDENKSYYLWHIQIIPRLSTLAGFELGSGIYINTTLPEETAEFIRNIKT